MHPDEWHLTDDIHAFLARAGGFLRARPTLHNTPLTTLDKLRARGTDVHGPGACFFGHLETAGEIRAVCYRLPTMRLTLTPLPAGHADSLAARLAGLGHLLSGVTADHDTATAFAGAWQRHTEGVTAEAHWWGRLHRLGTLTPPRPRPEGRGRAAGARDHPRLLRFCAEFAAEVGEAPALDAGAWADSRFADKHFTFWESPDGTPVSLAGSTPMVGGMIRVDPVYTPAHLRGRGYAGAVTAEVSRAALDAGATDVVLFTDPGNPTSNALYRRIGYVPVVDFTGYRFSPADRPPGVTA
ncbi:GNAT family N-acetyltransferase [Streptomyces sp. NPDC101225]|uniref:GNAT family N-acetyltransferase n=1 Tax=Streptomyces sp. NPDC101225 TaxID=3366135 RepID=UPI0037F6D5D9